MNLVALIGNVASKPELKYTPAKKAICTFRMAVSRPGGDDADFMTVVAWERQAEVCAEYLQVGRRVGVEGRIHQSSWEADGEKRSRVEVVAHRVSLLGAPREKPSDDPGTDNSGASGESLGNDQSPSNTPTDTPTDTASDQAKEHDSLMPV